MNNLKVIAREASAPSDGGERRRARPATYGPSRALAEGTASDARAARHDHNGLTKAMTVPYEPPTPEPEPPLVVREYDVARPDRPLHRHRVAANNSCLFTALAYLCEPSPPRLSAEDYSGSRSRTPEVLSGAPEAMSGPGPGPFRAGRAAPISDEALRAVAFDLRAVCARKVHDDADLETRLALLGVSSAEDYSTWVLNETSWGGEPEIQMISLHYCVEVVVASCESLRLLRYSAERPRFTVFLLYTGQHYDPLVGPPPTFARQFRHDDGRDDGKARTQREADAVLLATEQKEADERLKLKRYEEKNTDVFKGELIHRSDPSKDPGFV